MKKLIMMLVLMPLMVLADTEIVGAVTWSYKVSSEKVTIKCAEPCAGKLEIPQTLGGYPVSSIGVAAFSDCEDLSEMLIPEGVVDIGAAAFHDCIGLTAVTIPSTLVSIGDAAFEGCDSLTTVYVSAGDIEGVKAMITESDSGIDVDSLTFIEPFADGGSYTEVVDGIKWTFTISEGEATVEVVPEETVGGIAIPSVLGGYPVTCIGDCAFEGCSGLTSATIPEGVIYIGYGAFAGCSGLTSVTIPESVKMIGANLFFECPNMVSLTLPYCAIYYDYYDENYLSMFAGLDPAMRCIEISDWYEEDGEHYYYCEYYGQEVEYYYEDGSSEDFHFGWHLGMLFGGGDEESGCYYRSVWGESDAGEELFLPSTLKSVVITKGNVIFSGSFAGCRNLTSITLPKSVTSIGYGAFEGCSGLTSVTIPEGVVMIDERAFYGCSGLTSVTLPARFGCLSRIFHDSKMLSRVIWLNDGSKAGIPSDALYYYGDWEGTDDLRENLKEVVIPANVMNIDDNAFRGCHELMSVTFEGNAPDIGSGVFNGTPKDLVLFVPKNSIGWDGGFTSTTLPSTWGGRAIAHVGESYDWSKGASSSVAGTITVSNIVVHYVLNSVQPQFAISPSQDMGFVNIITEVKSTGVASIPMSWAMNYPNFVSKFGSDFTAALGKPTGKIGTGGAPMLVWQDYVAGTDPTDEKDVFTASITIVDGKVTVSYSPELDDARKAMRKYTTWGKKSLLDTNWTEVQEGHEAEYNFFKVSVEMR